MDQQISHGQAFPIDEEVRYSITINVKKNVITHAISWPNGENAPCPATMHELLGVLEYMKQVFMLHHGNYVQEAMQLKLKKEETEKLIDQQQDK